MTFDKEFWDEHWAQGGGVTEVNPHLVAEIAGLAAGTVLDAGAGAGTEANWLASQGWTVTAVDISTEQRIRVPGVDWHIADLTTWEPHTAFDLVTTFYAHAGIPQLELYERIGRWVAPGGTLLIVGHAHGGHHPDEASVAAGDIVARFGGWTVHTAEARERPGLTDVVVRLSRTSGG